MQALRDVLDMLQPSEPQQLSDTGQGKQAPGDGTGGNGLCQDDISAALELARCLVAWLHNLLGKVIGAEALDAAGTAGLLLAISGCYVDIGRYCRVLAQIGECNIASECVTMALDLSRMVVSAGECMRVCMVGSGAQAGTWCG